MTDTDADAANHKRTRKPSTLEVVGIHKLLVEHLRKTSEGAWVYEDDWTDAKVAETVRVDLPAATVARIRLEVFGALAGPGFGTTELTEVKKRLADIEARLVTLETISAESAKWPEEDEGTEGPGRGYFPEGES